MLLKKIQLVLMLGLFGLGLSACGDGDSGSSDKSQSTTPAAMKASAGAEEVPTEVAADATMPKDTSTESAAEGGLEAYDPDVPSMVVEDNGVIHEEEIYKAWPQ